MSTMFFVQLERNEQSLQRTFHRSFLPSWFIWPSCFRGEDFQKSTNQKQKLAMATMFVNGLGRHEQSSQMPFHRCFLQSFVSFGKRFQRRFLEMDQPKTIFAYGGRLLTDRDETSNLYRGPSIDASQQVLVHLSKRFQRRRYFRNFSTRNKNNPCLLTDWDDMINLYR